MPEIKNTFVKGKMNKDLDERIVPNGEYRDAMNIQLSTSDNSDVGAIENILGNYPLMSANAIGQDGYCVGSIADEKNEALYWLVAGPPFLALNDEVSLDMILQYKDGAVTPVVVDIYRVRTSYGNHDSASNTLLVPFTNPYIDFIEVGMVAQFDDAVTQGGVCYFGSNPITNITKDSTGNLIVTLQNNFNVPQLGGSASQASSFIFSKPTYNPNVCGAGPSDIKRVLNFEHGRLITGINIINDFLFFTDNHNEPKKIHIQRCIDGSDGLNKNTRLVVPERNITVNSDILLEESHVTLIKKAPNTPLLIKPNFQRPTTANALVDFAPNTGTANDVLLEPGDNFVLSFTNFQNGTAFEAGDEIRFLNGPGELPEDHEVRAIVKGDVSGVTVTGILSFTYPPGSYAIQISSVAGNTPLTEETYSVMQIPGEDSLFEKKFPRFSYRYKYVDGEYSTFAPFSDVIFSAASFDYDSKIAYNKGMQNYIEHLELRNFKPYDMPDDVVQVDILYKESNSPTIYVVDKIKSSDLGTNITLNGISISNWNANMFKVTSDLIYSVVPSNQLLRPFDNVPRKALAQEITGNRIVFANYLQNYNLETKPILEADNAARFDVSFDGSSLVQYELKFANGLTNNVSYEKTNYDYSDYRGLPTLKTIRNYQVGITYLDEYGRETPVFSSPEASFFIPKKQAENKSQIEATPKTDSPLFARGFKFYVKETSSEYYNLAMDRVYRAEDGNVWLAFPSSERNKVDEETFLYLKKQVDSNSSVPEQAKYKVIAIENEAPDFIKTEIKKAGSTSPAETDTALQTSAPVVGSDYFEIDEDTWIAGNNAKLIDVTDKLSLNFTKNNFYTKSYDVVNLSYGASGGVNGGGVYRITLDRPIDSDDQWIYPNFPTVVSNNLPDFGNNLSLVVYKHVLENKPEFEGKFFVKINGDTVTEDRLIGAVSSDVQYQVDARMNAYALIDGNNTSFSFNTTGYAQSSNTSGFNGIIKWGKNLDFNNPEDGVVDSEWFIDGAAYTMIHKPSSGERGTGNSIMEHDATDQAGGYGRAIQQETSGQMRWYIELSHSKLNPGFNDEQSFIGTRISGKGSPGSINFADINKNYIWEVGSSSNSNHIGESAIVNAMVVGGIFRFTGDTNVDNNGDPITYTITEVKKIRRYNHTRWGLRDQSLYGPNSEHKLWKQDNYNLNSDWDNGTYVEYKEAWEAFMRADNRRITYRLYLDKDPTTSSSFDPLTTANASTAIGVEFISPRTIETAPLISDNPAIWETEPKENIDLNIFHEASQVYPTTLNSSNNELYIPKGAIVTFLKPNANTAQALYKDYTNTDVDTTVLGWFDHNGDNPGDLIALSHEIDTTFISLFDTLKFTRHDNSYTTINLADLDKVGTYPSSTYVYRVNTDVSKNTVGLSWYNAFSFSNGVESDRLRDDFNQVRLDKGPIVSTTLDTVYAEERRSSGLIYSGIYNSNSGVNSLNQFIQAEKITKDLNPTYGSIQKLYSRNTDLVAFCEDKVIKILANKDAVFNADGNPNLIASENVLGQTMPFAGDYGISKNPESFAADNYRVYFTDRQRSAVLRLSMDGITNISDYGMSDWFGDNLQNYMKLVGSFDADKNDYNLTLKESYSAYDKDTTITYSEDVKGWVSFKSFIPENGISMSNDYYTFNKGYIYQHHSEMVDRNTFYGVFDFSSVEFLLNQESGSVKNYQTLNYEGSASKITQESVPGNVHSNEYEGYKRLISKEGWYVDSIITNKQKGHVNEFIEKEGKWFNYIKGNTVTINTDIKTKEFSFQGIGRASSVPTPVYGCTDQKALNYDPLATVDDGSCTYPVSGCTDPLANNYNSLAVIDDGSCTYNNTYSCDTVNGGVMLVTNGTGTYSSQANALANCPACGTGTINGCTDPASSNYDASATCDDGSCIPCIYGCTDSTIGGYHFPDIYGNCVTPGIVPGTSGFCDPGDGYVITNYDPNATCDNGSCITAYGGCTDPNATNYDANAHYDDGSCVYPISGCTDPAAFNYNSLATIDDGSCYPVILGCIDPTAVNYVTPVGDPLVDANTDDGSCCYIAGCTDPTALNYDPTACFEPAGTCTYPGNDWANIDPCLGCQFYGEAFLLANHPLAMSFADEQSCAAYNYNFGTYGDNVEYVTGNFEVNVNSDPAFYNTTNSGTGPSGNGTNYYEQTVNSNGSVVYEFACNIAMADGCTNWFGPPLVDSSTGLTTTNTAGCTDPLAINTNSNCLEDGSCIAMIFGCMDPNAFNYFPGANIDDGSCVYVGCTDPNALNYDPQATIDDGTCTY